MLGHHIRGLDLVIGIFKMADVIGVRFLYSSWFSQRFSKISCLFLFGKQIQM